MSSYDIKGHMECALFTYVTVLNGGQYQVTLL